MTAMSLVSTTSKKSHKAHTSTGWGDHFAEEAVALEKEIDSTMAMLPKITSFVTYGKCQLSASLDIARAVARRAETKLSQAAEISNYALYVFPYVNRLSDFLYAKARYADFEAAVIHKVAEVLRGMGVKAPLSTPSATATKDYKLASPTLSLAQANIIIENVKKEAKKQNLPVVAAVANAAGNPIAAQAMDGALQISFEAATAKAYTAAALNMQTIELSKLTQPGQPFYGLETLANGKILPIGGGIPICNSDGQLIGAVGVSGGTAWQDHELAAWACNIHANHFITPTKEA